MGQCISKPPDAQPPVPQAELDDIQRRMHLIEQELGAMRRRLNHPGRPPRPPEVITGYPAIDHRAP